METVEFEARLHSLDLKLFEPILSQTRLNDRRSLLAVQNAVRTRHREYTYLEIGSYQGGTIQSHLLDERCKKIYSIDKRPPGEVPDNRGPVIYEDNSREAMLDRLERVAPNQIGKITCFDDDARNIDPACISIPPNLCFIDGEHVDATVFSDFQFCRSVCAPGALIVFHDSDVVYKALGAILLDLFQSATLFESLNLLEIVFVIGLGGDGIAMARTLREMGVPGPSFIVEQLLGNSS